MHRQSVVTVVRGACVPGGASSGSAVLRQRRKKWGKNVMNGSQDSQDSLKPPTIRHHLAALADDKGAKT